MPPLSVLSWNTMGRPWHGINKTNLNELSRKRIYNKVTKLLDQTHPDIICLQEASQYLSLNLGEYLRQAGYAWIGGTNEKKGNMIASKFPIMDHGEIALEESKSTGRKKLVKMTEYPSTCSWVDCQIGQSLVRAYNCQFRVRGTGIQERLVFLERILENAKSIEYPVIICGDMNTVIPRHGFARKILQLIHKERKSSMVVDGKYHKPDERYAFNALAEKFNFQEIVDLDQTTWAFPYTSVELFKLKLDWFFIKNTECKKYALGPYITDHRPIFAELVLQ